MDTVMSFCNPKTSVPNCNLPIYNRMYVLYISLFKGQSLNFRLRSCFSKRVLILLHRIESLHLRFFSEQVIEAVTSLNRCPMKSSDINANGADFWIKRAV